MEEERVKKEIAYIVFGKLTNEQANRKANQILAIKGIRIEADDQSLPPCGRCRSGAYLGDSTQQDMLKQNWVKVLPEKEQEEK